MTKLSRKYIKPEKMSLFLDDFWTAVASLEDKTEARLFFNQFLTHTERKMFAKRFQIVMMILLKYDYQSIKERIKVSNETIAKLSNWVEENRNVLIKISERVIKLKNDKLDRIIKYREGGGIRKRHTLGTDLLEEGFGQIVKKTKEIKKKSSLAGK